MEYGKKKRCPVCHKHIDFYEIYCDCGYEFGGNRCSNPDCQEACGDYDSVCSICGSDTYNYLNGDIGGIPTNVM